MNKNMVLYTCAGGLTLVYLSHFVTMIPRQVVDHDGVQIARQSGPPHGFAGSPFEMPPLSETYKKETHQLNTFHEISSMSLRVGPSDSGARFTIIREEVDRAALKRMEEEFKIMVAKKKPDFFIKDLSIENVNKLAEKYVENFGGSDAYGVEVRLSEYQKFFAIVAAEDFKFFINQVDVRRADRPDITTEFLGKLVDLKPERWVMGRYEELTYLKEITANQRYIP